MSDRSLSALPLRLGYALTTAEPQLALQSALSVLAEFGVQHTVDEATQPWLVVEAGGQTLRLVHADADEKGPVRDGVGHLLTLALRLAAEHEQHQRTTERMRMLSHASFEGILIHEDGVIVDANERLAEIVAMRPEEILGTNALKFLVAPEDQPEVLRRMQNKVEGDYVISGVRADGSRFPAELLSKQGQLGDRPVRVVAVRDVTERERTQALLRESEARLQDLARLAFDMTVFSLDGWVIEVGGRLKEVLGYTREQFVGRSILEFVTPSTLPLARLVVAERRLGLFEVVLIGAEGELVPVEFVITNSTLNGKPVRVSGLRDLRKAKRLESERRKLEQQLERSQRLDSMGVLAGGIAHDFNNLLVGVLGNAELLLTTLEDPLEIEATRAILVAGERAANLTSQMLAYAGRQDVGRPEPVDVQTLLQDLSVLLGATLSKKARFELVAEPGLLVLGGRATLTQVFLNLLTNASDALQDQPGRIDVQVSRVQQPDARWDNALGATVGPGDWIQVCVSDDGVGMDAATIERAFEPFFSTKESGHGLGLAACLGIVSSHGGALLVESELGKGSRFSVLLPAALRPSERIASASRRDHERALKVLVIDDEPLVRSQLRRSLELRGYGVEEAADGHSGLATLQATQPDLVILDMTMPDLDGAEVVRRIRASGSAVPIVLASGYMDLALERRLERGAFQGFLRKPYAIAELVDTLERALTAE